MCFLRLRFGCFGVGFLSRFGFLWSVWCVSLVLPAVVWLVGRLRLRRCVHPLTHRAGYFWWAFVHFVFASPLVFCVFAVALAGHPSLRFAALASLRLACAARRCVELWAFFCWSLCICGGRFGDFRHCSCRLPPVVFIVNFRHPLTLDHLMTIIIYIFQACAQKILKSITR